MAIIVVTRLRLRDPSQLDDFFSAAVAFLEQANAADGALGSDVLADANSVWWTVSAWRDRAAIDAYVSTDPHATGSARLDEWCDEATFADWDQETADLPDWTTSFTRLTAEGRSAPLTNASPANETRRFPAPVAAT